MGFVEYACPNCGANIDITNTKAAYCQFCGTKIVNTVRLDVGNELYERAIDELEAMEYNKCRETVPRAIMYQPNNHDLTLMKAMLHRDERILESVDRVAVSDRVLLACQTMFYSWDVDIHYRINWEDVFIKGCYKLKVQGNRLEYNEDAQRVLVFNAFIFENKQAYLNFIKLKNLDEQIFSIKKRELHAFKSNMKMRHITIFPIMILSFILFYTGSYLIGGIGIFVSFILGFKTFIMLNNKKDKWEE